MPASHRRVSGRGSVKARYHVPRLVCAQKRDVPDRTLARNLGRRAADNWRASRRMAGTVSRQRTQPLPHVGMRRRDRQGAAFMARKYACAGSRRSASGSIVVRLSCARTVGVVAIIRILWGEEVARLPSAFISGPLPIKDYEDRSPRTSRRLFSADAMALRSRGLCTP